MIASLGGHKENDETMFIHCLCLCSRARSLAIMLNCNITKMAYFPLIFVDESFKNF